MKKLKFLDIKSIGMLLGVMLGTFILGRIMHDICIYSEYGKGSSMTTFPLASIITMVVWAIMAIIYGAVTHVNRFNMIVGMGETRKSFVVNDIVGMFVYILAGEALLAGLMFVDDTLNRIRFPMLECELYISSAISIKNAVFFMLLVFVSYSFLSVVLLKLGKNGMVALWIFYMVTIFALSQFRLVMHGTLGDSVFNFIEMCVKYRVPILGALSVIAIGVKYLACRRQSVAN